MNHLPPSLLGAKEQSQTQQNGRNWPNMLSLGGGGLPIMAYAGGST